MGHRASRPLELSAPLFAPVLFAAVLAACGSSQDPATIGPGVPVEQIEAPAVSVPSYRTDDEAGDAVRGDPAVAAAVVRGIEGAAEARSMPLAPDARLAQLATWVSERLGPEGQLPTSEVIEFFAHHLGLVEPVPHMVLLGPREQAMDEAIQGAVEQFMDRQVYNRYGGVVIHRGDLDIALVMLSWRWVELTPMPRRVDAGTGLRLQGRLLGAHENPSVVVASPDGAVRRLPAGSGPGFDVRVPTTAGSGAYRVEVLGRGTHGDTVIANFPVYVGVPVPETVRFQEAARGGGDVESVRRELIALLNQARQEGGVRPLTEDDGIARVALAHSEDMAANSFIGHTSPTTGSAADRVRSASLPSGLVLENIGRGYSASEIHRGLMASPGHRANLINPDVTHVGIGIVAETEGSRTAYVATQLFLLLRQPVDLTGAAERLLAQVNRARAARRAPPLELRDHLQEAAQHAADEYFADPSLAQEDVIADASADLRRFAIAYRRIGGVMAVVNTVDEAATLEPTFDPEVRYVGIGAAQGDRPDTGPNAIGVVFLLAWPR